MSALELRFEEGIKTVLPHPTSISMKITIIESLNYSSINGRARKTIDCQYPLRVRTETGCGLIRVAMLILPKNRVINTLRG